MLRWSDGGEAQTSAVSEQRHVGRWAPEAGTPCGQKLRSRKHEDQGGALHQGTEVEQIPTLPTVKPQKAALVVVLNVNSLRLEREGPQVSYKGAPDDTRRGSFPGLCFHRDICEGRERGKLWKYPQPATATPSAEGQEQELEEKRSFGSRPGPASSWLQPVPPVSCSHLGRFLDKGGFQHLYGQEPPDKTPLQDLSVTHWHPHGAPPHAARLHASHVQKLLEILITKRAGLKVRKEKGKEQGPGYHLDSS
ncbi:hypothetical protein CB1_000228001, partial [Camelus ferus]